MEWAFPEAGAAARQVRLMSGASLRELVPRCVRVSERRHDHDPEPLYPEEAAHISRAVVKRRREFTTVRRCAREALGELGLGRPPMVPGEAGSPTWPDGVVGSMTHCAGYRAAAVALASDVCAVGIDAEPNERMPAGVLGAVASEAEAERLRLLLASRPGTAWDRLLFSAKESVYKAWFPLTRQWLGFEEADVVIDPSGGFRAALARPLALGSGRETWELAGRWSCDANHLMTSIVLFAAEGTEASHSSGTA